MPQLRSCAGFRKKTRATTFICQVSRMNHFQGDFATQICVERFVCDAHGAAAEFDWLAIATINELILVEAVRSGSVIEIFAAQRSLEQAGKTRLFCALR